MTFLDSNILVYSIDDNSPEKQRKARAIVASAIGRPGFMVSAQVLNEFANVALAKLRLTLEEAGRFVAEANGCDEFWSEDLNDGQLYCGIRAVNPFK